MVSVFIPRKTTSIKSGIFSYPSKMTIYGVSGTYAEAYAQIEGIKFVSKETNATSVRLEKTEYEMLYGQRLKLNPIILPSDFTDDVSYKSSNSNVANVSEDGLVISEGVGTATIKISVGDISTSCKIIIRQPVTSIYINDYSIELGGGETHQLKASVYPGDAYNNEITWRSTDETIATVDANGLVTAKGKGECRIYAEASDGSGNYDYCEVNVTGELNIVDSIDALESIHPYENNSEEMWQYSVENAGSLSVKFDERTSLEDGFDYIYIYDGNKELIGTYTGDELSGQSVYVPGNTVKIKLVSDEGGNDWGFRVIEIIPSECNHDYTNQQYMTDDEGKHYKKCRICKGDSEHIACTPSKAVKENIVAPTCEDDGYHYDVVYCQECNQRLSRTFVEDYSTGEHSYTKYYSLGNGRHKVQCEYCETTQPGHENDICSGGIATCYDKARCVYCWAEYGELISHKYLPEWEYDNRNHWHECSICDEENDFQTHTFDAGKVTKQATENTEGIKTYLCTICGYVKTEKIGKIKADNKESGTEVNTPKNGEIAYDSITGIKVKVLDATKKEVVFIAPKTGSANKITVPSSVTIKGISYKITKIDGAAFKNNKKVSTIKLPNTIKIIEKDAFSGAKKLKSINIPSSVTTIGNNAFKNCSSLTKLTLPTKTSKIGTTAFSGCKKLKTLTIKSTKMSTKTISKNAFKGITKNTNIKVPKKQVKTYQRLFKSKGLSSKVKVKK